MRFILGVGVGLAAAASVAGVALFLRDSTPDGADVYGDGKEFGRYLVSELSPSSRDQLRSSDDADRRGFCVLVRDESTTDENAESEHTDLVHEGARWLRGCEAGIRAALSEDD